MYVFEFDKPFAGNEEPMLWEVMADPMVHAVLARDGLKRGDVWDTMRVARDRLIARGERR